MPKATATIASENSTLIPDNLTRDISAADVRTRIADIVAWLATVEAAQTLTATAHGFVAGDVGKPIGWTSGGSPAIWNDATAPETAWPVAILKEVVDANTIRITAGNEVLEIADALLPASMPSPGGVSNSRFLYWDASAAKYVAVCPSDSLLTMEILYWLRSGSVVGTSKVLCLLPSRPSAGLA